MIFYTFSDFNSGLQTSLALSFNIWVSGGLAFSLSRSDFAVRLPLTPDIASWISKSESFSSSSVTESSSSDPAHFFAIS